MLKFFRFLSVATVLAACSAASASTTTPLVNHELFTVGQGDIETQFQFTPTLLRGDADATIVQLTMGVNYFWNDMLAPGVEFDVAHANSTTAVTFLPNLKAYYPTHQKHLPYAQVGMGFAHAAGQDAFDLRLGPGIDFMLANNVAIGFQFKYDLLVGDGTVHKIEFPLGFAIYFKL